MYMMLFISLRGAAHGSIIIYIVNTIFTGFWGFGALFAEVQKTPRTSAITFKISVTAEVSYFNDLVLLTK